MNLRSVIALAIPFCLALSARGDVVFSFDFDPAENGFQTVRDAAATDLIDVNLLMSIDGESQVSGYSVSVRFDADELELVSFENVTPDSFLELVAPGQFGPSDGPDPRFLSREAELNALNATNFVGTLSASSEPLTIATLRFRAVSPDGWAD
ncbi:MAG: hypothetical protein AAGA03_16975 [Planctomycetota bacterium]